ncbi:MAG: hypothetical protein ACO23H_03130 [Alphaproteobacteria bacterium]
MSKATEIAHDAMVRQQNLLARLRDTDYEFTNPGLIEAAKRLLSKAEKDYRFHKEMDEDKSDHRHR